MHFGKTSFLVVLVTDACKGRPWAIRETVPIRHMRVPSIGFRHHRWLRHNPRYVYARQGGYSNRRAPLLSDRNVGPVPPELMLGCFVVAGLIVTIVYSIDWSSVF